MNLVLVVSKTGSGDDWETVGDSDFRTPDMVVTGTVRALSLVAVASMNRSTFTRFSQSQGHCPNACSGHGVCDHTSASCSCFPGWKVRNTSVQRACITTDVTATMLFCRCWSEPWIHNHTDPLCSQEFDCSERQCPFGRAWAIGGTFDLHRNAECSNAGDCDEETGECDCYPSFEGSACQRSQ